MSPFVNPNAVGGAVPSESNPQSLPQDQIDALKKDPEIIEAASQFIGSPVTLDILPVNALMEIAGMVQKLGVQGAVQMLKQKVPQDVQAKLRAAVAQKPVDSIVAAPRG